MATSGRYCERTQTKTLEVGSGEDFPAFHCNQGGVNANSHALTEEVDRAVGEEGVDATHVEGVGLVVVRAVERAVPDTPQSVSPEAVETNIAGGIGPGGASHPIIGGGIGVAAPV